MSDTLEAPARPATLDKETVKAAKPSPDGKRYELRDHKAAGLRLIVQPVTGAKSWAVRWSRDGTDYRLALGEYPAVGLDAARIAAGKAKAKVFSGVNPVKERREEKRIAKVGDDQIFKVSYARWMKEHLKKHNKPKTWIEIERVFRTEILPVFGDDVMTEIPKKAISDFVADVAMRAGVIGNNCLRWMRQLFNWCIGKAILITNPTESLTKPTIQNKRKRFLRDDEIRWCWLAADKIGWPYGPMVQMLLVTGARLREVAEMPRSELDIDRNVKLWTLDESRSKTGVELIVHLTPLACAILAKCPKIVGHKKVFERQDLKKPNYSHGKTRLDALMLEIARAELNDPDFVIKPFVIHDLRRTFRSGCAAIKIEQPNDAKPHRLNPVAIEKCMNHKAPDDYDAFDYRDDMIEAWSEWSRHIEALIAAPVVNQY